MNIRATNKVYNTAPVRLTSHRGIFIAGIQVLLNALELGPITVMLIGGTISERMMERLINESNINFKRLTETTSCREAPSFDTPHSPLILPLLQADVTFF